MEKEKKIGKWILLFFAAMLVCTVLSRVADSVTIPKVRVESMGKGTLEYIVEGEGVLSAEAEEVIFLPMDAKPISLAKAGTEVKEGEVLATFDMDALKEKKADYEAEKKKLEISLEQERLSGVPDARASEGDAAQQQVNQLSQELNEAVAELAQKREEYDKRAEEEELEEEEKQALETGIAECEARKAGLEQSLAQAQSALESARINDANAEANSQKQRRMAELSKQSIQVDLEQKRKEIKRIEELIQSGGKVTASSAGTITEVTAVLGSVTSGQEYFKIGKGNRKFTAQLEKEKAAGLKEKDQILITASDGKKEIKGKITVVQNVSNSQGGETSQESGEDQTRQVEITAELEENELAVGTSAHFKIRKESKEYDALVPLSVIREDGSGKYVLILEEENSILGKEWKAARVNVEVQEQNESSAAVNSALTKEDQIITGSNKTIKAGDRVRKE